MVPDEVPPTVRDRLVLALDVASLDEAVELAEFIEEIGATELDLLAGTARTKRVSVEGHSGEFPK